MKFLIPLISQLQYVLHLSLTVLHPKRLLMGEGGTLERIKKRREVQGPKLESEKRVTDSEKGRKKEPAEKGRLNARKYFGDVLLKFFLIRQ